MTPFPPRLHVLLARDAQVGLVIRRGPSDEVATILWDRRRDTFELGQWLKGRIYERRCDLSPDGRHFLYFAMNGHWASESRGSWTAIARAPYLHAIAMFTKGDCWHGGGLFLGNERYWLNDGYGHVVLRDTKAVVRDHTHAPSPSFGGECPGVYFHRLVRDGWRPVEDETSSGDRSVVSFERPLPHHYRLRKLAHAEAPTNEGRGVYWDEHVLIHPDGLETHESDWSWADLDGDRLVFAKHGTLYAKNLDPRGPTEAPKPLHDFTPMTFEHRVARYS